MGVGLTWGLRKQVLCCLSTSFPLRGVPSLRAQGWAPRWEAMAPSEAGVPNPWTSTSAVAC